MAYFTMELRELCESIAGLEEHSGIGDVDGVIDASWEEVFGGAWDTHDSAYKKVLCSKILRHYWLKEIGTDTPSMFLFLLRNRMCEIMPYFNQLYESALIKFNPMHDYEIEHTAKRVNDGTNTNTQNRSTDTADTGKNINKFSDTPQGVLDGVESGTYLTSATVVDSINTGKVTDAVNGEYTLKNTEDYSLHISGKTGGKSYSKLLKEFRDTVLNIDMMIIENLHDLFMGLWM